MASGYSLCGVLLTCIDDETRTKLRRIVANVPQRFLKGSSKVPMSMGSPGAVKIQKAIRSEVCTTRADQATEKEIIEKAVGIGVAIEQLQRKDIGRLRNLEAELLEELADQPFKLYITQYKGRIIQKKIGIAVTEKACVLSHLSQIMQRRIKLEREAYNLDATTENEKPDWTKEPVDPRIQDMFDNPDLHTPPESDE